jgi:hypothetical protein
MFFNDSGSKIVSRPSRFSVLRHALIEVMRPEFEVVHRKIAHTAKSMIRNARERMIKVANPHHICA